MAFHNQRLLPMKNTRIFLAQLPNEPTGASNESLAASRSTWQAARLGTCIWDGFLGCQSLKEWEAKDIWEFIKWCFIYYYHYYYICACFLFRLFREIQSWENGNSAFSMARFNLAPLKNSWRAARRCQKAAPIPRRRQTPTPKRRPKPEKSPHNLPRYQGTGKT